MTTLTPAPLSLWAVTADIDPPSGAVVAAVLAFGDVNEVRDDGLTLVRISAERLAREDMRLLLSGDERDRAIEVAVVWDPGRFEMVRVIDAAQPLAEDRRRHGFPRLVLRAA